MNFVCNCKYCEGIDYTNSDFFVDMSFLKKKRPVGVSGLLRVKNDADFLSLCIDSCIDAVDELIIVYQESSDDSIKIIEQKCNQYPDKIKSYFYKPKILSHNLTDQELNYAKNLPNGSIHLLSNYYNYTLSKASYRYAVKIDADQIYFTDKLKKICDAYRSDKKEYISFYGHFSYFFISVFAKIYCRFPLLFKLSQIHRCLLSKMVNPYKTYSLKRLINTKSNLLISGINLFYKNNEWFLTAGSNANSILAPFNGVGDSMFFEITDKTYYYPLYLDNTSPVLKYCNSAIELFTVGYSSFMLYGGFLWFHMAALKKNSYYSNINHYKNHLIAITDHKPSYRELEKYPDVKLLKGMQMWYSLFWDIEKNKLPAEYLTEIKHIIESYNKNN